MITGKWEGQQYAQLFSTDSGKLVFKSDWRSGRCDWPHVGTGERLLLLQEGQLRGSRNLASSR